MGLCTTTCRRLVLAGTAILALGVVTGGRAAAADPLRLEATDPAEPASGDLGPAKAAVLRGPRPASPAIVAAKKEADAAYEAAVRGGALGPAGPDDLAPAGGPAKAAGRPTIVDGRSFAGLTDRLDNLSPSDATGAIGPTRFIQLVNARFGITRGTASSRSRRATSPSWRASPGTSSSSTRRSSGTRRRGASTMS